MILIDSGSRRSGKSLNPKLKLMMYVYEGKMPSWVIEIYNYLTYWNLNFIITCSDNKPCFSISNVNENLWEIISDKCEKMDLNFIISQEILEYRYTKRFRFSKRTFEIKEKE